MSKIEEVKRLCPLCEKRTVTAPDKFCLRCVLELEEEDSSNPKNYCAQETLPPYFEFK